MPVIKSNRSIAQEHANGIGAAMGVAAKISQANLDTQSTIAGNTVAHAVLTNSLSIGESLQATIETASKNLKSVAENFEQVDQDWARAFRTGGQ